MGGGQWSGIPERRGPRPRAGCPFCGRDTAVTFGVPGSGKFYLRPHHANGERCRGSGRQVLREKVNFTK